MIIHHRNNLTLIIIFFISFIIFVQGLNIHGFEYRDDEIFYYKSTQEMLRDHNYMSPTYFGEDRFQKPILFYWLILFSYKIFGVSWFSARFVSALFAAMTVCITWLMAKQFFDKKEGEQGCIPHLSAVILTTLPLFFRHAKNAVPDMVLNFFIVLAFYCAIKFIYGFNKRDASHIKLYSTGFFVSCGLGFMIKGFAALIFPIGTIIIYALMSRQLKLLKELNFFRGFVILAVIILPWFLYMVKVHGQGYLNYMVIDETKNRLVGGFEGNFILYKAKIFLEHAVFYLRTMFSYFAPWSIFAVFSVAHLVKYCLTDDQDDHEVMKMLLIWFLHLSLLFQPFDQNKLEIPFHASHDFQYQSHFGNSFRSL